MLDQIVVKLNDPHFLFMVLVAVAATATILTLAMPLLDGDTLGKRMRAVSSERDTIRARERERLAKSKKGGLRQEPKAYMKQVVDQFSLSRWLGTQEAKGKLAMAGYRGPQAEIGFLFFRLVMPIALFFVTMFYVFVVLDLNQPIALKVGMAIGAAYVGIKIPEVYIKNKTSKRQFSMKRAFPDSLDLLLICVESGMSIEHAFQRVSVEISIQSVPLAEEFALTLAELSYLPDRRTAYENFSKRTGVEAIKQISTVLIQAERYGTPLGTALRVVSQESRDNRMMEAEKKAASLPPKLTVPMIIFFLPVLFAVILTPAILQIMGLNK